MVWYLWIDSDKQEEKQVDLHCSYAWFWQQESSYGRFKNIVLGLFFLPEVTWMHFNSKLFTCCCFSEEKSDSAHKGQVFLSKESNENADSCTGNQDLFYWTYKMTT